MCIIYIYIIYILYSYVWYLVLSENDEGEIHETQRSIIIFPSLRHTQAARAEICQTFSVVTGTVKFTKWVCLKMGDTHQIAMLIGKMIRVHWDWGCRICGQTQIKNVKPLKNLKINWNRCFPVTSFDHDSNCTRPEASQCLWDDLSPPMIDPHNLFIYINLWNQWKKLSCARFRRSFSWKQDATTAWPKIRSFHQITTHLIRTMMIHRK